MQISLDLSQIIITIINFLVLYFVLKKILFKPVMKVIKDREDGIAKSIRENDDKKKVIDELRVEYDIALRNQEILKQKISQESKQKALVEYNKTIENAKVKSKGIQDEADFRIEEDRKIMLENVKQEITSIAVLIASKVTNENMNTEKNNELVNKFIREVDIK